MSAPTIPIRHMYQRLTGAGLARDSLALIATSGLSAGVGLIFWAVAARMLPPASLGVDTALLSLMITAGTIAAVGVGNSFNALLPTAGCDQRRRLIDGYGMVAVTSGVVGIGAGVVAACTLPIGTVLAVVGCVAGAMVMAFFTLKDSAMVGLGGATRLPAQNLIVSAAKLVLLPLFVLVTWHPAVLATLVSAALAAGIILWRIVPRLVVTTPSCPPLVIAPQRRDVLTFAARDGLAASMSLGVLLAMPFITTAVAGPVQGAVLALSLSVAQLLDFVSTGVGTALTTRLASAPTLMWQRARSACLATSGVVVVAAIVVLSLSPLVILVFGPDYRHQPIGLILAILVTGSVVRVAFVIWASVLRAQRRTATLLKVNAVTLTVTMPVILLLTAMWGAVGAALGLSLGSTLLGLVGGFALLRGGRRP